MKTLSTLSGGIIQAKTCHQWYMFEFDKNVPQTEKDFFGQNEGEPYPWHNSTGLLNGKKNVQTYSCNEINKTVPYFREFTKEKYQNQYEDMGDYLSAVLRTFSDAKLDFQDRQAYFPEQDNLPDGAFIIKEVNKKRLKYNL
jgi:hypothetical protein